jgi:hypothetical protein
MYTLNSTISLTIRRSVHSALVRMVSTATFSANLSIVCRSILFKAMTTDFRSVECSLKLGNIVSG